MIKLRDENAEKNECDIEYNVQNRRSQSVYGKIKGNGLLSDIGKPILGLSCSTGISLSCKKASGHSGIFNISKTSKSIRPATKQLLMQQRRDNIFNDIDSQMKKASNLFSGAQDKHSRAARRIKNLSTELSNSRPRDNVIHHNNNADLLPRASTGYHEYSTPHLKLILKQTNQAYRLASNVCNISDLKKRVTFNIK